MASRQEIEDIIRALADQGVFDGRSRGGFGGGGSGDDDDDEYQEPDILRAHKTLTNDIFYNIRKIYSEVRGLVEPWAKADAAASKYAKTIATTEKGMNRLRKMSLGNTAYNGLGIKYNISTEELLTAQQNYVNSTGRAIRISKENQEDLAAMRAVIGDKTEDLANKLEHFGVSLSGTGKRVGKMFSDASKSGISLDKYASSVAENINMAQNYTFKNGLKGLESMAKKAVALKLEMQQVASFADSVNTIEGAIKTAASLQVLGGPFAQLSDPMGMLYEGLNDIEGLQDRLRKMVGGLGTFNKETGEVEISGYNRVRIKEAAKAMNISPESLLNHVTTQGKRDEIEKQISASKIASKFSDEYKELIKNVGTFENGKAGVNIDGKFKSLDSLTEKDRKKLEIETRTDSDNIREIAKDVRSLVDIEQGFGKQIDAWVGKIWGFLGHGLKFFTKLAAGTAAIIALAKGLGAGMNIFGHIKGRGGLLHGFESLRRGQMGATSLRMTGNKYFTSVINFFKNFKFSNIISAFKKGGSLIKSAFTNSFSFIKSSFGGLKNVLTPVFSGLKTSLSSIPGKISGVFSKSIGHTGAFLSKSLNAIKTPFKGLFAKKAATTAASSAGKIGSKLLKGGAGFGLGIAGAAVDIITDSLVAKGKIKKGGTAHHIGSMAGGALTGAGIGMMFGPIGAAIGAAIGGSVGLIKANRAKHTDILSKRLEKENITLKGTYGRRNANKIHDALDTGEISKKMRRKLRAKGDFETLDKINAVKKDKEAKNGGIKKNIKNAVINVGVANFNGRGFNNLINPINPIKNAKVAIRGIKEVGLGSTWEKIKNKNNNESLDTGQRLNNREPIDININGTLKLTGDNGQSVDIIQILRNTPTFLRSLAELISKEIKHNAVGTYRQQ